VIAGSISVAIFVSTLTYSSGLVDLSGGDAQALAIDMASFLTAISRSEESLPIGIPHFHSLYVIMMLGE
jgi:hypothetical protein